MRILITGTPGTGKTSVSKRLSQLIKMEVVHLNDIIFEKNIYKEYDKERESYVVDLEKMERICKAYENVIIEGHLAHYCMRDGDIIIILRANPLTLKKRLKRRGYNIKKIEENVEAEIVDAITQEVLDLSERYDVEIYEIDTSDKKIDRIAIIIKKILENKEYGRHFLPGNIDYTDYLLEGKI